METRLLEGLDAAIDVALAADLDRHFGDDDQQLRDDLWALQRHKARVAALEARLIDRYRTRSAWAGDRSRSATAALARDARISPAKAKALLARGRKLSTMPASAAALAAGEISAEQVDLLSRANQPWRDAVFAEHETSLVGHCRRMRWRPLRQVVDYWCQGADSIAAEDGAAVLEHRRAASIGSTLDGETVLRANLPAVGGAAISGELARLERILYLDDQRTRRDRTIRQRRADALVQMALRSRASVPGGLKPRPLISILVGEDSFRRTCELAEGSVITPGQLVPLLGDADIERIVFDGPDRVLSVSKKRRFAGALRRAVEVRDRHCQHPSGCDEPASNCDVDHIEPWPISRRTSQVNGRLECRPHNRDPAKHDPGDGLAGPSPRAP
ncbi:MAG: DUF222 domain-containing protein [Acidimicrobiia bacterium]|nr:DUF222 domain-containing protein [Acidimicrobiia bacterium]